jgi:hypothetical protein
MTDDPAFWLRLAVGSGLACFWLLIALAISAILHKRDEDEK